MIFDDAIKDMVNFNDGKRAIHWKESYLNNRIIELDIEIPEIGGEIVDHLFTEEEYKLIQEEYSVKGNLYRWKPTEESKIHTDAVKAGIARKKANKKAAEGKWREQVRRQYRTRRLQTSASATTATDESGT